jgi:Protein of unknown function (DUF3040)
MELSSRDKRILAEIECGSALQDPKWVRRLERLGRRDHAARRRILRRAGLAAALCAWVAAVVLGCSLALPPLLWAALGLGGLAAAQLLLWRRRSRGPGSHNRRISRIPRQGEPRDDDGIPGY